MKKISTLAVSFLFAAIFSVSAFAQAGAQPAATKIGWIVTSDFSNDKDGIAKYIAAEKALETEMRPRALELQTIQAKMKTLSEDLAKFQQANSAVPVDLKAAQAKQDEGQRLQREYEFKQKEAQAVFAKRREEVLTPISTAIFQALQQYAKEKGYAVVLDVSTLGNPEQPSPILVLEPSANITKDFITYYNARQPGTAATATPK